jgi:D-arginine dehydrogenase
MTFDFIIIGAGMAGASLAYELAQANRVCLLEAEAHPGVHTTGRSAALFAPSYGGTEIRAITRASQAFFLRPPDGFCEHPLLHPRGCLWLARSDQAARLDRMVEEIARSGGQVSPITPAQALDRVPQLRRDYVASAALDTHAMDIDVAELHQGFLRGARRAGAVVGTNARVLAAQWRGGLWTVPTAGGVVNAPVIINAAGAWADQVAAACGARPLGLQPLLRTAMIVDAPQGADLRDWPTVIDADEEFYFKPEAGRLLLSPADETLVEPCDAQPDEMDIAVGVERVQAALDLEVRRIRRSWAGLRTFATDRIPVIGFDPELPQFFWCAGQGGYGIQTAPALARTAAALAQELAPPADVLAQGLMVSALSPTRFANAPSSKSRAAQSAT